MPGFTRRPAGTHRSCPAGEVANLPQQQERGAQQSPPSGPTGCRPGGRGGFPLASADRRKQTGRLEVCMPRGVLVFALLLGSLPGFSQPPSPAAPLFDA